MTPSETRPGSEGVCEFGLVSEQPQSSRTLPEPGLLSSGDPSAGLSSESPWAINTVLMNQRVFCLITEHQEDVSCD